MHNRVTSSSHNNLNDNNNTDTNTTETTAVQENRRASMPSGINVAHASSTAISAAISHSSRIPQASLSNDKITLNFYEKNNNNNNDEEILKNKAFEYVEFYNEEEEEEDEEEEPLHLGRDHVDEEDGEENQELVENVVFDEKRKSYIGGGGEQIRLRNL